MPYEGDSAIFYCVDEKFLVYIYADDNCQTLEY